MADSKKYNIEFSKEELDYIVVALQESISHIEKMAAEQGRGDVEKKQHILNKQKPLIEIKGKISLITKVNDQNAN